MKTNSKMEEQAAIDRAVNFISRCGNKTADGYKECVRDAFTPFSQRYQLKPIHYYYGKIIESLVLGSGSISDPILDGIKSGLRSVYAA